MEIRIENDGPRYRWAMYVEGSRVAKGARWWNSVAEAERDAQEFCDAAPDAKIVRPE